MVRCFVVGCPSTHPNDQVRFFRFPHQDSPQFQQWLKATGSQDLLKWDKLKVRNCCRICSIHFSENYRFRNFFTKADMPIPSENLPNMDKKTYKNPEVKAPEVKSLPSTSTQAEPNIPAVKPAPQAIQVQSNNLKRKLFLVPNNVKIKSITQANGTMIAKQLILPSNMNPDAREQLLGSQIVGNLLGVPTVSNFNNNIVSGVPLTGSQTSFLLPGNMKFQPMPATAQIKELTSDALAKAKIVKNNTQTVCTLLKPPDIKQINKLKDDLAASEKSKLKAVEDLAACQKQVKVLERRSKMLRRRLLIAQRELKRLEILSPTVRGFLDIQLRSVRKNPICFSDTDKLLALSMFRCNRKCYHILRQLFSLPSRSSLNQFLDLISISPGINANVLCSLKAKFKDMNAKERKCLLIFDEIRLAPHFDYSENADVVLGFEDNGLQRLQDVASVAQVYILCGVFKKWRIPIAYNFCKRDDNVSSFIKEMVIALEGIGFKPMAFLSDHGEAESIQQKDIIPLCNSTALLMNLRNSFIGCASLKFVFNCRAKTARWADVEGAFRIDRRSKFKVISPKQEQIFSKEVAACIEKIVRKDDKKLLDKTALGTAYFCSFIDKLLESFRGNSLVTLRSKHNRIWHQALKVFKSMEFKNASGEKVPQPPIIKQWISTVKGVLAIRRSLLMDNNYGSFSLKSFSKDAFNEVYKRMKLLATKDLTCLQYSSRHKAYMLDDLRRGNIENTKELFTDIIYESPKYLPPLLPDNFDPHKSLEHSALGNIASFIVSHIDPLVKDCETCATNTKAANKIDCDGELKRLKDCAPILLESLTEITNICNYIMPYILHVRRVSVTLQKYVQHNFAFHFTNCAHSDKLETTILEHFPKMVIMDYVNKLNKILSDKKHSPPHPDTLQTKVLNY